MTLGKRAGRGLAAVGLAIVLAACGGGDDSSVTTPSSGTPTTSDAAVGDEIVIESPDGLASLTLQPGSLPDGVAVEDITLEAKFTDSPGDGMPFAGVALSPDGLVLSQPAQLAIQAPEAGAETLMIVHSAGDRIEFLTGDIDVSDGSTMLSTTVGHFSWVFFTYLDVFTSDLTVDNAAIEVGDSVTGSVTVTNPADAPITVWVALPSDEPGTARPVTMSAQTAPRISHAEILWDDRTRTGFWDPESSTLEMAATDTGWQSTASARCLKVNETRVVHLLYLRAAMTLISVGDPEPIELVRFPFPGSDSPTVVTPDDDAYSDMESILAIEPGETFAADFSASRGFNEPGSPVRCSEQGSSTDGTTSATSGPGSGGDGDPPTSGEPSAFDRLKNRSITLPLIGVSGDDVCGNAEDLANGGADVTARASSTGGQIDLRAGNGASGGLTVVLEPTGGGGATSEDRRTVRNGERDSQELSNIAIGDGTISADLTWRNHDGCETSLALVFTGIPNDITDWFESLPAPGPSSCELVDAALEDDGETMTLRATVLDRETGQPAPDQLFVITVSGGSGATTYEAVSIDGSLTLQVPLPAGDRSSITVSIRKDAHTLGTLFFS